MDNIVISGLGVLSSIGVGKEEFKESLLNMASGIKPVYDIDRLSQYPVKIGAQVSGEIKEALRTKDQDITVSMAQYVVREALSESKLLERIDGKDIGICVATSLGGIESRELYYKKKFHGEDPDYRLLYRVPSSCIAGELCKSFGFSGLQTTVVTACAAGGNAIGIGRDMIRNKKVKAVVVVGVDPFSAISFSGFSVLKSLGKKTAKPFDKDRDGIVIGEGASCLILETEDNLDVESIQPYGVLAGYGISNDAYHVTTPDPRGGGAIRSIESALQDAGIVADKIDYINAHGTATRYNDDMEILACKSIFGEKLKDKVISSTKSQIGHTLGNAGVIEAVVCLIALRNNFLPATINLTSPMCDDLDFSKNKVTYKKVDYVLSNSFAFGGNTASVIFERYKEEHSKC